jgi:hypothetical protein
VTVYEGAPVPALYEHRIAFSNGAAGTVSLVTEDQNAVQKITRFGTGPGELQWVHRLARPGNGFLAGSNGTPPLFTFSPLMVHTAVQ